MLNHRREHQLSRSGRIWLIIALSVPVIILTFIEPPLAQDPSYHNFADQRLIAGIPNFFNVISNVAFLAAGLAGLSMAFGFMAFFTANIMERINLKVGLWLLPPFALLGIASVIYMMSQNRQSEYDRIEARNDFEVNQKTEEEVRVILLNLQAQNDALLEIHTLLLQQFTKQEAK